MTARKKDAKVSSSEHNRQDRRSEGRGSDSDQGDGSKDSSKKGFSIERFPLPTRAREKEVPSTPIKATGILTQQEETPEKGDAPDVSTPVEEKVKTSLEQSGNDKTMVLGTQALRSVAAVDDKTYQLNPIEAGKNTMPAPPAAVTTNDRSVINHSMGLSSSSLLGGLMSGSQASLTQAQNLKIAQQKIFELEAEIEKLREKNEALGAAGETLKKRNEELRTEKEDDVTTLRNERERFEDEKEIFLSAMSAKERKIEDQNLKLEEYEMRLSSNIQKIRVRERELENRLELLKMEGAALVRNKDEIILNMKRTVDQLNMEIENYRSKGQDLNKQISDKKETLRRTVRALRLALSMLEGSDKIAAVKKAEES